MKKTLISHIQPATSTYEDWYIQPATSAYEDWSPPYMSKKKFELQKISGSIYSGAYLRKIQKSYNRSHSTIPKSTVFRCFRRNWP